MEKTFSLKVVTPVGAVIETETSALTLQTAQEEITILPDHTHYTTTLGTGIMRFTDKAGQDHQLITSGGFASFTDAQVLILTDSVDLKEDIEAEGLAKRITELEKELGAKGLHEADSAAISEQLARARAQSELIGH